MSQINPELIIRQAIAEIFSVTPTSVAPLNGLYDSRIFICEIDGRRIAAKLPDESAGVRLSVREQFRVLHRAAAHNLTPNPIAVEPKNSVLFAEWEVDASAAPFSVRATASVVAAADVLRLLHRLPIRVRKYAPQAYANEYARDIRKTYAATANNSNDDRVQELLSVVEEAVNRSGARFVGDVCCHNDLHAGNFLHSDTLQLIDFEYAVQADPVVDLASFVVMNALDDAQINVFLSRYSSGTASSLDPGVFADAVAVHHALCELWRLAREPAGSSA